MRKARDGKTWAIEKAFVRPEVHAGTGIALTAGTGHVQIFYFIAVFKRDAVDLAVAAHVHLNAFR